MVLLGILEYRRQAFLTWLCLPVVLHGQVPQASQKLKLLVLVLVEEVVVRIQVATLGMGVEEAVVEQQ
jgi:hypothetical protein